MSQHETEDLAVRLAEGPEMIARMRMGVIAALEEHKRLGRAIVVYDSETGEIRDIPPEFIAGDTDHPTPIVTKTVR